MENVESFINDRRLSQEFRQKTFCGFKTSDVKKELLKQLTSSKIEGALYFTAELICSGDFTSLWETIFAFYSRYIHIGNVKLAILIDRSFTKFRTIARNGYSQCELNMRNCQHIRKIFCQLVCVLCVTKRKHCLVEQKISRTDFEMTHLTEKLQAPTIEVSLQDGDPMELLIAVNEMSYHIRKRDAISAIYWVEWILEYDAMRTSKKDKLICARRSDMEVQPKYQVEPIWIVWELLLNICDGGTAVSDDPLNIAGTAKLQQKVIQSLLNMFCASYSVPRKRKYMIYIAVSILTEAIDYEQALLNEKQIVESVIANVNDIYLRIKNSQGNEVGGGPVEQSNESNESNQGPRGVVARVSDKEINLHKTIARLDAVNAFSETFIPRIPNNF